ncbi:MAG: hypothetical protein FJ146_00035 [Deltaproteobacteria bacterium]|nr:hypothetical protein [Deltaproteobacteria bacterium]
MKNFALTPAIVAIVGLSACKKNDSDTGTGTAITTVAKTNATTEGEGGKIPADPRFGALYAQLKGLDYIARGYPKIAVFKDASGNELATFTNTFDDKKRIVSQSYTIASGKTESDLRSWTGHNFYSQAQAYSSFGLFAAYVTGNPSKNGSRTYSAAGTGCPDWLENSEEVAGENTVSTTFTCEGTKVSLNQVRIEALGNNNLVKYTNTLQTEFDANFVVPMKTSGTWVSEAGNNGTFTTQSNSTNTSEYTYTGDKVSGFKADSSSTGSSMPASSSARECALVDTDLTCNITLTSGSTSSTSTSVVSLQANKVWPWVNGYLTQITKSNTTTGGTPVPQQEFDEKGRSTVIVNMRIDQNGTKSYLYYALEYPDATSLKATKMTVLGNDKATAQGTVEFTWD